MKYLKNAVFCDVAAATCSRWFLARGFFYPEDGGDTFLETSVHRRSTRRHVQENGIFHSHHRENLKSYIMKYLLCEEYIWLIT
jgi:hypothetical protein